jgi:hypothetical protein
MAGKKKEISPVTENAGTDVLEPESNFPNPLEQDKEKITPTVTPTISKQDEQKRTEVKSSGSNLDQKENSVGKKITLRAIYGKTQGATRLRPPLEKNTQRIYTGQGNLNEEQKRNLSVVVTHDTVVAINDGHVFDLSDEVQAIHWKWVQKHSYIAESLEAAQNNPYALFYVEDLDVDMDKKSDKRDLIFRAMDFLKKATESKKREIMRLIGTDAKFFTYRQVTDHLEDRAFTNPAEILNAAGDRNYHGKLLLYRLIDGKMVTVNRGVYKYGDIVMGVSEEQALEFMKDGKNIPLIEAMRKNLE